MERAPAWLADHAANVHSQAGEDGVIAKVLETLTARDRWCVEFGAWDGEHLSNTRRLIEQESYSAVLIEGDKKRAAALQERCRSERQVTVLNRYVGFGRDDSLDAILAGGPVPVDFDLLSIDIDGNDYHVWQAIKRYRPKVVVIEFNPTIPNEVKFVQPADRRVNQGASLLSLVELGKKKGYELVAVLEFNAFFVRAEDFPLFLIADNRPATLRSSPKGATHIFFGYDGTVFIRGARKLPWHGVLLDERRFQPLPGFLRKYPERYGWLEKLLFSFLRRLGRIRVV
ncbi:MAG: FkbM family methyltransferase [Candidatus Margulisiibacteriota bacterium]